MIELEVNGAPADAAPADVRLEPAELDRLVAAGRAAVPERSDSYQDRVATARAALAWAHETFGERVTVASSMGDEVLVHLAGESAAGIEVFFLDTGYHFDETIETRDAFEVLAPVKLITITPRLTVAEQDAEYGPKLHDRDPDACCAMRKVEPMERALSARSAWVTGMRRVDAPTRTDIEIIGIDAKRGKIKINPIAAWTDEDVARFTKENYVYENPLRELGYASIGCAPCTRAVKPGEDPRAGRWAGRAKTECGLHT
ncbi:phosphoadenosine phosphosulfate reductase [Naumannella cuiyingiana]|uniref:Adenosine 5'-phosphosulfate reductase n=1 Tax=Naumannella cuiyingiana TaxID=1347891 RepID=A0A7Z0IKN0_9ACTN|nr:phosphoadenylyl-sulfate reductase [Naumannella cuiyingiana]NYI70789.1 phosphoadenosine phosphosulfate reductase [Naumannella cuiyingiana]